MFNIIKFYLILNYFAILLLLRSNCEQLSNTAINKDFNQFFVSTNNLKFYQQSIVDYVTKIFCTANGTYSYFYIYMDRSVSAALSGQMIRNVNSCMTGGVMVSE